MRIDRKVFYREATQRICSSMDINTSLSRLFEYMRLFVPIDALLLQRLSPGSNVIQQIAAVFSDGRTAPDDIFLSKESSEFFVKGIFGFGENRISVYDRLDTLPSDYRSQLGLEANSSMLAMGLTPEGNYLGAIVALAKRGWRFTDEHAEAFDMLHKPLSIALANALNDCIAPRIGDAGGKESLLLGTMRPDASRIAPPCSAEVLDAVNAVAGTDAPVLLMGEIGVGKGAIARLIHDRSARAGMPFIAVSCGAIPARMADYYLSGHEKDAIPETKEKRRGPLELAHLGTLYLESVDELPREAQNQLLHAIRNKETYRLGGSQAIPADVRIIASTQHGLLEAIHRGSLLVELWYALSVFPIAIPPLRERPTDIMPLVHRNIELHGARLRPGMNPIVSDDAVRRLLEYPWPGNERELEGLVERELVKTRDGVLRFDEIGLSAAVGPEDNGKQACGAQADEEQTCGEQTQARVPSRKAAADAGSSLLLDDVIADHIKKVLAMTQGRIKGSGGAAELLGVNPSTLRGKMAKLGIESKHWRL